MIENEYQYDITRREAGKFRAAIAKADCPDDIDPDVYQGFVNGMREQLSEMEADIRVYEKKRFDTRFGCLV